MRAADADVFTLILAFPLHPQQTAGARRTNRAGERPDHTADVTPAAVFTRLRHGSVVRNGSFVQRWQ